MSDTTTTAQVNLQVNGQQAEETLRNLRKHALDLTEQIAKAAAAGDKVTLQKLRKELRDTNRQIKEMESATMQVDSVLRRLDKATPHELQKTLTTLNKQLQYMERGSEAWNIQAQRIRMVKDEISRVNGELAKSQTFLERFNAKWQEWQTVAMGGVAALTGAVLAGKKAVQMYAEMEQEMASVRKYTGMTAEQVEHLNEEFKKIDTRSSREELNRLAQEAGRLGKSSEQDVLGFVKAADQINVALDDLGEGATLQLSKLTSIFGDEERLGTERSLLAVGSVINELSQNCTAGAAYLSQFGQRLAGVGAQAGMTVPQVMAFGAVLDSQGQKVEMSATALSKLIMNLFKNTEKIASATGMDLEKFNAALKSSTNEGLLMLLNRLNELGDMSVLAPVFADMGENGARASAVISALAGNIDMLVWEQQEAAKAFDEATSVTKEFEVQNNTVQASLDKARKGFQEMAISLGQELMPVMRHFISSTSATMRIMLNLVKFIKEHRTAILSLAAAVATYTVAVNLALIKEKAHAALIAIKTAAMHVHRVAVLAASVAYNRMTGNVVRANAAMKLLNATMLMNPWGLLAAAIVGVGVALVGFIKKQREVSLAERTISDIRSEAAKQVGEETARLNILIKTAENEKLSLDKRKEAIRQLNQIIPNYNAQLDETTGEYRANKAALDAYLVSLAKQYEIEGARGKLKELGEKKADLSLKRADAQKAVAAAEANARNASSASGNFNYATTQGGGAPAVVSMQASASSELAGTRKKLKGINDELKEIEKTEKAIFDIYGDGLAEGIGSAPVAGQTNGKTTSGGGQLPAGGDDKKADKGNKFQKEDDWREREQALNRIAYAKGTSDYEQYNARMLEIEVEYNRRKLLHKDLVGNEEVTIEAAYQEALEKQKQTAIEGTVQQEEEAYKEVMAVLQQRYMDGELSARQYQNAIEMAELEHLQKVVNLYDQNSKERIKAEKHYHDTSLKYQQKHLQEARQAQEKMRQTYFTKGFRVTDDESYQRDMQNLELVYKQMLKAAGDSKRDRLRVERAFYEAKYQLARKYNKREAKELKRSFRGAIDDSIAWLESDAGKAMTESFSTIVNQMGAIFSGLSDIIQAELDIQTARIEAKYDREISYAEGNKSQEVALEQQKQAEIGKAKQEANRKMFAMQVMQAVAQTAMSAIAAYSSAAAIPVVGFVMAPIAAAMAVAAGAIQIAAIKKQQEASEATGYMEGGFTKPGRKDEPAGIVHAGEWVASQDLLRNPQARAMIETLDYAQRTNTIGRLSASDVSQSITAPQRIAKASSNGELLAVAAASQALSRSVNEMNNRLHEPFVTVNTVTGDAGIKKAQDEYNQLMRNKTPKSRR